MKEVTEKRTAQILIRCTESTLNAIRDISHSRKKAKNQNNTLGEVFNELIVEGLKTITK